MFLRQRLDDQRFYSYLSIGDVHSFGHHFELATLDFSWNANSFCCFAMQPALLIALILMFSICGPFKWMLHLQVNTIGGVLVYRLAQLIAANKIRVQSPGSATFTPGLPDKGQAAVYKSVFNA